MKSKVIFLIIILIVSLFFGNFLISIEDPKIPSTWLQQINYDIPYKYSAYHFLGFMLLMISLACFISMIMMVFDSLDKKK